MNHQQEQGGCLYLSIMKDASILCSRRLALHSMQHRSFMLTSVTRKNYFILKLLVN